MLYKTRIVVFILVFILATPCFVFSEDNKCNIDYILQGIETRYIGKCLSASFVQKTTLKAMEMTDSASGTVLFKFSNMMRWEYNYPTTQQIISDGTKLWFYVPEDNQVMIGNASSFFKNGKGASFLTDVESIRKTFFISMEEKFDDRYKLKLVPIEKTLGISHIFFVVSEKNFDIIEIVTYNEYGDENLLEFTNIKFVKKIDELQFKFTVPKEVDVLQLED